ncbi:MAG: hypothetical protein IT379_41295 [Deltaproteobacteria bacterium]|nr:hypothetical protein [Deltaproteobacteria bacterium]
MSRTRVSMLSALLLWLSCGPASTSSPDPAPPSQRLTSSAEPADAPEPRAATPQSSSSCPDRRWGGYDGGECAALAARIISGAHSACSTDADCALVHRDASCREQAAAAAHVARYRALPAGCTHPAGGPCPPARPACVAGCCTTTH